MQEGPFTDPDRWQLRALLVLACASAALACALPSQGEDRKERLPQIRVVGSASVSAAPDRVSLDVSVVSRADGAREAAERNATATKAVVEKLRQAFAASAELSTSGYTLQPEYEYDKAQGRRTQIGVSARNTVHVVLSEIDEAGALIDAAVGAGANEVHSVRFGVSDPDALEQRALSEAAVEARSKAEALAASLGARLGRTLRVEEQGSGTPRPPVRMMARAESAATPIEPPDIFVEVSVSLWVELVEP